MSKVTKYQSSEKAQTFIDSVSNGKYDRQIIKGLKKFFDGNAPEDVRSFYSLIYCNNYNSLVEKKRYAENRNLILPTAIPSSTSPLIFGVP